MRFIFGFIASLAALVLVSCTSDTTTSQNSPDANLLAQPQAQAAPINYIQNLGARKTQSLDGRWARIIDPYENGYYNYRYQIHDNGFFKNQKKKGPRDLVEYNFDTSPKLTVPGDWNTQERELYYYEGTVWYQRYFDLQKREGQKYIIQFGAVNYHAIVYVNGEKVGEHEGGFTSFQFDISEFVKSGENFIVLKVDNSRARDQVPTVNTDWWNYGGITRSVFIAEIPDTHIVDYTLSLSPDMSTIKGTVTVSAATRNAPVTLTIKELGISETFAVRENGTLAFSLPASPKLWSPETPKLYDVSFSYDADTLHDKIGFRTITVEGDKVLLNGKAVFMRGISIHEESLLHAGRAHSKADARATLELAKDLGTNFVRLAHYPHNEEMVKMADELGLMVWSEIPVYWTVLFGDEAVYRKAETQLVEMMTRDKNRASIVMWSVANETPLSDERHSFLGRLINKARRMDNTRLITAAIDTHSMSENEIVLEDPLAEKLDVIGINSYCGWYWAVLEDCAKKVWKSGYDKPIIMSEMGGGAKAGLRGDAGEIWTEEFQAAVYDYNLQMADNIDGLAGISPWILKDFLSPRRQLGGIQDDWNRKGLVSETGEKKLAWDVLQSYYEKKAAE
jgi:beta-glucuronidase